MKTAKKHLFRITSILLCFAMLFVFMPQAILAEAGELLNGGETPEYAFAGDEQASENCDSIKIAVREVTSSWAENTLTWNNQPSVSSTVIDYRTVTPADTAATSGAMYYFNITSLMQKWYNDSANGIRNMYRQHRTEYSSYANYAFPKRCFNYPRICFSRFFVV